MGRKLNGWLVVGACVFALAKCGETKSPPVATAPAPTRVALIQPELAPSTGNSSQWLTQSAPEPSLRQAPPRQTAPGESAAVQRSVKRSLYVTGKEVPLRAAPDSRAKILDRLPTGMEVGELARREGWVEVRHPISAIKGWMSTRRLTTKRPSPDDEAEQKPTPKIEVLTDTAIIAKLITLDAASYSGNCRCPENTDRAGRRCGARSAHSRAGGRAPLCYPSDVSPGAIAAFRASGGR
ncbi:SH3 domain-containing protein [Bosea sp. LjRoot237]|uniref:SH3 domain-containing protein n=1 Tax=Bosea sp. LjRoot237 TaxID=3342292 RepID=UPI003F4FDC9F